MKITDVTVTKLSYEMDLPMADAIHFMPARTLLVVHVHTDAGITGIGESAAYGGSLTSMETLVTGELRTAILGKDPFMVEQLWRSMTTSSQQRGARGMLMMAVSGVDIALWDIVGQATNTPLYRLLGGYRDSLTGYASAGFYANQKSPSDLADEAGGYVDQGFSWLKMKVGRNPDVMLSPLHDMPERDYAPVPFTDDVERVQAVREAVGPEVRIAIDANNAWTPSEAIRFMRQVEPLDIAWLEEPVSTEDLAGSAEVARAVDTPVAGYETETSLAGFRNLITAQAVDIVQPDVIWSGGITPTRKIAALAEAYHLPVIPHVFSSAIATVANMHLIASIPNGGLLECDQNPNPLRTDLLETPVVVDSDGVVSVPDEPGLGIRLNQDTVERYRVH